MKRTIKIIALLLVAAMALTSLAGCGSKKDSVGTIDGTAIPTEFLKFTLSDLITNFEANYGVSFSEVADEMVTEQLTVYQYYVSYAVSVVQQAIEVDKLFDELGLEWTDEAQTEYDSLMESYYTSNGGEEAVLKTFSDKNIDISGLEGLMKFNTKYSILTNHIYGENGEKAVTNNEIIAKFHTDYARIKHILVATVDTETYQPYDGEKLTEAQAKYTAVEAKVKALAVNDEAGFTALMNEYNEDPGMTSSPDGYVVTDNGQFIQAFVDGAFSVAEGEYAFVESEEYGYHILMRLPTREADITAQFGSVDAYLSDYRSQLLSQDLGEKMQSAEIDIDDDALSALVSEVM